MEPDRNEPELVVPVIEEEVVAGAQPVKTGSVRVDKHVEKRIRRIETPLLHEEVEIRRVAVDRIVTEAPPIQKRGDTVIIPVLEEQLVITKRLVLKEEIHLVKRRGKERAAKEVELDRERPEVHRFDSQGKPKSRPRRGYWNRTLTVNATRSRPAPS